MAELLKLFFDERVVRSLAADVRRVYPSFDARRFIAGALDGLDALELTPRAAHISEHLERCLPADFERACELLMAALGPEQAHADSFGLEPFRYLPYTMFVARRGLEHFEPSMHALYELTKRFTAEGSIRAFLVRHPERTHARLVAWARDPNVHVRRLVSEGTRPRLPWAPRLRAYQADPTPVIALLELLKDDPERYVQRSVANNLNDIAKDHPERAVALARSWSLDAPPGRRWIVGHALRSLVKAGHPAALSLLGWGAKPAIEIAGARFRPRRVRLGEVMRFSFELRSLIGREQELLVDYAVHFVKANGERRPKVFKLKKLVLPGGGRLQLEGKVSFCDLTTRVHYAGKHAIDVLVNGQAFTLGEFAVHGAGPA